MGRESLRGKNVIITGASSGIGAQLAREMAGRGARVGLLARREDRLRELGEEIGGDTAWAAGDVTDTSSFDAALGALEKALGAIDIAVANAGTSIYEPPHRFKPGEAMRIYDINLAGMVRMIDWALPRFLERGRGHLVGVASVASYFGLPAYAAYCGSKAAMRTHLQSLRVSLRPYDIAVTTICPGFVESELTDDFPAKMPFLWPVDRAGRRMADAIAKRQAELIFPWQMRLAVLLGSRLVPRALVERLVTPKRRR